MALNYYQILTVESAEYTIVSTLNYYQLEVGRRIKWVTELLPAEVGEGNHHGTELIYQLR